MAMAIKFWQCEEGKGDESSTWVVDLKRKSVTFCPQLNADEMAAATRGSLPLGSCSSRPGLLAEREIDFCPVQDSILGGLSDSTETSGK